MEFPFLTCQWKLGYHGDTHRDGQLEGAQISSIIMRYLEGFYHASGQAPSIVDTCHFSLTCDCDCAVLYVHWIDQEHGETVYCMEEVETMYYKTIFSTDEIASFCGYILNIVDHAVGKRLDAIKKAIPGFEQKTFGTAGIPSVGSQGENSVL